MFQWESNTDRMSKSNPSEHFPLFLARRHDLANGEHLAAVWPAICFKCFTDLLRFTGLASLMINGDKEHSVGSETEGSWSNFKVWQVGCENRFIYLFYKQEVWATGPSSPQFTTARCTDQDRQLSPILLHLTYSLNKFQSLAKVYVISTKGNLYIL